jgi:hypothetical protein
MKFDLISVPVIVHGIISLNIHSYFRTSQFGSWLIVPDHYWKVFVFLSLTPLLWVDFVL